MTVAKKLASIITIKLFAFEKILGENVDASFSIRECFPVSDLHFRGSMAREAEFPTFEEKKSLGRSGGQSAGGSNETWERSKR